ncbi:MULTISPECIES: ABC transporter ATP-binding protein [unclassified Modestobacter]|uniref:ABC transporter ATP-binding protein n=1 Tax=unclassified Modestobacter TaxID=2643866 RepID=UPI0022AAE884|nr:MULTISPECIES: ABC transporter ATP-binding protein [unclassified Modestobacter]MCZ2825269.1 ABC transporter ATP-binding protein [Modestobacter sp. VKM Ac-2981]MCZ2853666.1 ABC transporter ATP-binding protein [Modestobacter sp. VKM Ac-2982]
MNARLQPAGGFTGTGLVKRFRRGAETVSALAGVGLEVGSGEFVALVGPSGSGKSTLLALLCGWETADEGELAYLGPLAGRRPEGFGWRDLALVPQALGLVADLSLADNVLLPARLSGTLAAEEARARSLLTAFGVEHLADRYPHQASLGEQQRVAVARALLLRPAVLLADEPTAHQDRGHADRLLDAVTDAAREGSAVLIATHDEIAWARADRVLSMRDGVVTEGLPS